MKTLGQIAYEAYCNEWGNDPDWDGLAKSLKRAWGKAGEAAGVEAVLREHA